MTRLNLNRGERENVDWLCLSIADSDSLGVGIIESAAYRFAAKVLRWEQPSDDNRARLILKLLPVDIGAIQRED